MAAALFRAAVAPGSQGDAISEEVEVRAGAILPVLEAKVRAAVAGVAPAVTGRRRAARNVAEHSLFGAGAATVQQALQAPQRAQRAGRSAGGHSPACAKGFDEAPEYLGVSVADSSLDEFYHVAVQECGVQTDEVQGKTEVRQTAPSDTPGAVR